MQINVLEKQVLSSDKKHYLKGKLYIPSGEIKGYFQIVHGMTEHIGRYNEFLLEMAKNGYMAFGFDNLGHGLTAICKDELGYIARKHGYKLLVKDIGVFYNSIKEEYGEKPYYLMGHSMGSFIVRTAVNNTVNPTKVILSGTGGKKAEARLGILLIKILRIFQGGKKVNKFMDKLAFGSYNKKFASEGSKRSWLTTDASVRTRYDSDELCNYRFGLSAMEDVIRLNIISNSKKRFKAFGKTPVLMISGVDDPVGGYGKGVKEVYDNFNKNNVSVNLKLYNGRHEVFNEPTEKQAVYNDVLDFISK